MLTASPITPVWEPSPTAPETTRPLLMPIRSARGAGAPSERRRTTASIASAVSTVRRGSSSCVTGAPNTATIASPMNFSTNPSLASTSSVSSEKVSVISVRSSSGSRCSASVEKPTRSAKRTVTRRRSPTRDAVAGSAGPSVPSSGAPHEPQKRNPAGFSAPQEGQAGVRVAPQEPQNRASAGLSNSQAGHRMF